MAAGFYERRVFPWLNDRMNADPDLLRLRAQALEPARGRVLEIGFGSGLNLEHYPSSVESLVAVEPNPGMQARAAARIAASRIPVEVLPAVAERMPLPDASVDTAVSTLTLCTVAQPVRVLAELRRVLRDEGRLVVLEHGLAEDPGIARWQRRLNPLQRVLACGCNLDRPIGHWIESEGFRFDVVRRFFVEKLPRTHGWVTMGTAVKA